MSNTSNATAKDDDKDEPGFFESIANLFSGAGADLPSDRKDDDGDSGISFYDSPMFTPYDGGSDDSAAASTGLPFETTAADRALYEALGVDVPEVYTGKMGEEEPEPNIDMDVLQKALQPEPITVEEIEVKAGDTLTAIAEEKGVPVQDVIDANPQIKNPDLIRPGEIVSMPAAQAEMGLGRAPIMSAQQDIGQARAAIIMKGIDKLFGLFPPKTDIEKKTKSELEYFLDAQPESSLPDFFKYVPDKVQLAEYMKGRAERKKAAGVTEADTLSTAGKLLKTATDPEAPAPVSEDPDREFYQSGIPLEDRVFEGTDPRNLGGAEGYGSVGTPPEASTGEGLMSDPRKLGGAEGYGNPVGDLSTFSKPVDNSYTEFMDIEGDTSHLGGADYKEVGITLPMGIVPTSGLKYTHNGTTIDLPKDPSKRWAELSKAGVTLKNFDASNVDMSQVVKDGIKRSDYDTDENFTKAVLSKFEDSVIKEIENEGVDVDKLDDSVLEGLISLAWNVQGHKWKDIEPAYKEMVKENPDMTKVQSGMLQVFTSNGIVVRGLAERRAKDYNKVAEGMGQPTIESYTPVKLKNGNAGFEYAMSDGTTVTRDTGKDYATKASQGSFKKHLNNATNL
jgi:LysM repeat protein